MTGETRSDPELRALPQWAWALAILFFPVGPFIALGAARAIRWSSAILLAVASYALGLVFVYGMIVTQDLPGGGERVQSFVLLGFLFCFISVGQLQHALGDRAAAWSDKAKRAWRTFRWIAVVGVVLVVTGIALRGLMEWRGVL